MRVLTVCDSDSYLKWAVALLEDVPADWRVRHLVLTNVLAPSDAQVAAAGSGWPVRRRTVLGVAREVRAQQPDVVLVACTGPALEAVVEVLAASGALGRGRPVLATGLPGISYPANDLAVAHRRHFDVMVLHSHREVAAYAEVVGRRGSGPRLALATLPFLRTPARPAPAGDRRDVVFAAQALVPADPADRRAVLAALARVPRSLRPVVKVRALAGERQAHNERHPYAELWAAMPEHPREIEFRAGAMSEALGGAYGFATVSSTAAIEALAAGVPTLVLGDFGVGAEQINLVFEGSGLIGDLSDLAAARFRTPDPAWLRDNHFHDPVDDDWRRALSELVGRRAELPAVTYAPLGGPLTRARRMLRMLPRPGALSPARLRRSR